MVMLENVDTTMIGVEIWKELDRNKYKCEDSRTLLFYIKRIFIKYTLSTMELRILFFSSESPQGSPTL